jgi:hypothetical protein
MGLDHPHYRGFTITLRHTTPGRTPLEEWSARLRDLYRHNTKHSQQTDIEAPGGIRIRNPGKRGAGDPRLRRRGCWDQQCDCRKRGEPWRNRVRTSICRQKFETSASLLQSSSVAAWGNLQQSYCSRSRISVSLPATGLANVSSEHSRYFGETRDGSKPLEPLPTLL